MLSSFVRSFQDHYFHFPRQMKDFSILNDNEKMPKFQLSVIAISLAQPTMPLHTPEMSCCHNKLCTLCLWLTAGIFVSESRPSSSSHAGSLVRLYYRIRLSCRLLPSGNITALCSIAHRRKWSEVSKVAVFIASLLLIFSVFACAIGLYLFGVW